ncbi:MAG: hypothetical protein AAFX93_08245 [Verrucomicrobiota bacterium]
MILDLLRNPPDGMKPQFASNDTFAIEYRRSGMGCMNVFLMVWLAIWTAGCVLMIRTRIPEWRQEGTDVVPIPVILLFWAFEFVVAGILLYLLFCRKSFLFDEQHMVLETRVLFYKKARIYPRNQIQQLVQFKDGGGGDDSFPSWGLKLVHEGKKHGLIHRQPHEKSQWLGSVIAAWAGVSFVGVPE